MSLPFSHIVQSTETVKNPYVILLPLLMLLDHCKNAMRACVLRMNGFSRVTWHAISSFFPQQFGAVLWDVISASLPWTSSVMFCKWVCMLSQCCSWLPWFSFSQRKRGEQMTIGWGGFGLFWPPHYNCSMFLSFSKIWRITCSWSVSCFVESATYLNMLGWIVHRVFLYWIC